jgi:hypothetical protein
LVIEAATADGRIVVTEGVTTFSAAIARVPHHVGVVRLSQHYEVREHRRPPPHGYDQRWSLPGPRHDIGISQIGDGFGEPRQVEDGDLAVHHASFVLHGPAWLDGQNNAD